MSDILRFDTTHAAPQRWIAGVLVSRDCRRLSAAMVGAAGTGLALRPEIAAKVTAQTPAEIADLFAQLSGSDGRSSASEIAGALAGLRAHLADAQASLLDALLAQAQIPPSRILVAGVQDPGLWDCGRTAGAGYLGLCDAARLAELTGMNIIDAFAARDVASGGLGGPLTALAEWVLLRDPRTNRLLLDLGRTARMTWLPRGQPGAAAPGLVSFDAGPGMGLLDLLSQRLTGGKHMFDPGGRLAVQGCRIAELIEYWSVDPYFRRPLPRWRPRGVPPERFLVGALQKAVDSGWSVRDMLCTATHFVAETINLAIRGRLPRDATIDEIIITGGGQQNGMLLREIAARLPGVALTRTADVNFPLDSLGPACTAILALFYVNQVPANSPEVTGTEIARVLGRLTPGSPQSWQRLLAEMTGSRPAVRPLRSAL